MPYLSIDGDRLYYEIEGTGDWLVFAHGGDGNHLCWWKQVSALNGRFRCVTYDAMGFGLSVPSAQGGGTPRGPAEDLLRLMDHLEIDRAILVGHSMGGMPVSGVAQANPERVRALVMSDTPFGFATPALSRWADEMIAKISNGFDVLDHLFAPGFAAREPEMHDLYMAICRMKAGPPAMRPTGDDLYAPYVRMRDAPHGDYSAFPIPSLFIVGDQDELTLPWMIEGTAAAIGGAQLRVIPGAGHSPFFEQTALYNDVLAEFLQSV